MPSFKAPPAPRKVQRGGLTEPPVVVIQAEAAVLGSMLIEGKATRKAADLLKAGDFYRIDHQKIYAALLKVYGRDGDTDLVTVAEQMRGDGTIGELNADKPEMGGARYLTACMDTVAHAGHVEHYARLVKEASLDRQVVVQLHKTAEHKTADNLQYLRELMDQLHGVRSFPILDFRKDLGAAIDELLKAAPTAIKTGFKTLDEILGGLEPGNLTTIGARTSGGKTAFMTKMAMHLAETGVECLYVTTEMTNAEMVGRVLPMATNIPAWKFRWRKLQSHDLKNIVNVCASTLSTLPLSVFGKSIVSLGDLRRACAQMKPRVVFVDYLQRCEYPQGETRAYQIMNFMRDLKTFAQEMRVNVVIGCQLDRRLDKNAIAEPENADLKDSGAIEAESDQVVLLWKPNAAEIKAMEKAGTWTAPPDKHHVIRAKVSKNRHGVSGMMSTLLLNGPLISMSEEYEQLTAIADMPAQPEMLGGGIDEH